MSNNFKNYFGSLTNKEARLLIKRNYKIKNGGYFNIFRSSTNYRHQIKNLRDKAIEVVNKYYNYESIPNIIYSDLYSLRSNYLQYENRALKILKGRLTIEEYNKLKQDVFNHIENIIKTNYQTKEYAIADREFQELNKECEDFLSHIEKIYNHKFLQENLTKKTINKNKLNKI